MGDEMAFTKPPIISYGIRDPKTGEFKKYTYSGPIEFVPTSCLPSIFTRSDFSIKKVIFNGPATIIFWENGDKTVVKCHEDDTYDKRLGFMYACTKRICELGGFCATTKANKKPFDKWMDAWIDRKAEDRNLHFSDIEDAVRNFTNDFITTLTSISGPIESPTATAQTNK